MECYGYQTLPERPDHSRLEDNEKCGPSKGRKRLEAQNGRLVKFTLSDSYTGLCFFLLSAEPPR